MTFETIYSEHYTGLVTAEVLGQRSILSVQCGWLFCFLCKQPSSNDQTEGQENRAYLLILCYAIILSIIDAAGFVAVVRVPEWSNNS